MGTRHHDRGSAYAACPSGGIATGHQHRITTPTGARLTLSSHVFQAPAGTLITALRWGGRFARGNCDWGTMMQAYPSKSPHLRPAGAQRCAVTGLDIGSETLVCEACRRAPQSLQQTIVCAAATCQPGAAFHTASTVVTIDDPTDTHGGGRRSAGVGALGARRSRR